MRRTWPGLGLLTAVLFGLCGCKTPQPQIKPPKLPEEYVTPPTNDKRYDEPMQYPKDTLNQDKQLYKEFVPPGAPGSKGGGPGMKMGAGGV